MLICRTYAHLAWNRKVFRQLAGNPKGRKHNNHERRRLQAQSETYGLPTAAHFATTPSEKG
jgi:hypothetical protein